MGDSGFGLRDILTVLMSMAGAAAAIIFGSRLWLRDQRKDSAEEIRTMVRLEEKVTAMQEKVALMQSAVSAHNTNLQGLVDRLEARDRADHEAAIHHIERIEERLDALDARLETRIMNLEKWARGASGSGGMPVFNDGHHRQSGPPSATPSVPGRLPRRE